jgi:hypothetical protein
VNSSPLNRPALTWLTTGKKIAQSCPRMPDATSVPIEDGQTCSKVAPIGLD